MPHHKHHHHHHHHNHGTAASIVSGLGKALYVGAVIATEVADAAAEQRRREEYRARQLEHERYLASQASAAAYQRTQIEMLRQEELRKQREAQEAKNLEIKSQIETLLLEATKIIHGELSPIRNLGSYLGFVDNFKFARDKLNTADVLARQINYYDAQTRIKSLNTRLSWLEGKAEYMQAATGLLLQVENQEFDRGLLEALEAHIKVFKTKNTNPSVDESELLANLNHALQATKIAVTRMEDKTKNVMAEQKIMQIIVESEAQMKLGAYAIAAKYLRDAKAIATSINHVEDITQVDFVRSDYFDASILVLTNAHNDFCARAELHSKQFACEIIDQALQCCNYTENKTLLGRHRQRLQDGMAAEFYEQWRHFDQRPKTEFAILFKEIQDMIAKELLPTTIKKTLGTVKQNGLFGIDQAGLYLNNSKLITPLVRAAIRKYRSPAIDFTIDVPVFTSRTRQQQVFLPSAPPLGALVASVFHGDTEGLEVPTAQVVGAEEDEEVLKQSVQSALVLF